VVIRKLSPVCSPGTCGPEQVGKIDRVAEEEEQEEDYREDEVEDQAGDAEPEIKQVVEAWIVTAIV